MEEATCFLFESFSASASSSGCLLFISFLCCLSYLSFSFLPCSAPCLCVFGLVLYVHDIAGHATTHGQCIAPLHLELWILTMKKELET